MAVSKLGRRVLSLAGATAASQIIVLSALPLITRLYPPDTLGIFASALSVMTMLSVVACLRYEQAIPLVASRSGSSALVWLSFALAVLTMSFAAGVLHFSTQLSDRVAQAVPYPFLIALGACLLAMNNILIMWATGRRMIKAIVTTRLVSTFSDAGFKIGLGLISATGMMLLSAYLLGLLITILIFVFLLVVSGAIPRLRSGHIRIRIRDALLRHRRYLQLGLLETVFTTVAMQAPVVLFAGLFGPSEAALLFLGQQVMRGPITLISNAVGRVFLSELALARKSNAVEALIRENLRIQSRIGMPILILLGLVGSALADWGFGKSYAGLSHYMLWMVPWMIMVMLVTPFTTVLYSYERFGAALILAGLGVFLRVGAVLMSFALSLDPIVVLSIASMVTYSVYLLSISRTVGIGPAGWMKAISVGFPHMIAAAGLGLSVLVVKEALF